MVMTDEDYKKHLDRLDRLTKKGEKFAMGTKFFYRHIKKFLLAGIALLVGGALCFLWGYFGKLGEKVG